MKHSAIMLFLFVFSVLAKKPNILFILTDDQAPHTLSSYGNKVCQTPHIDKLASSGMVLDQAYHMGVNERCSLFAISHHDYEWSHTLELTSPWQKAS